jgi:hypothetical protein
MKHTSKLVLVVLASAAVSSAQAQYNNGDLLLGFNTAASTGDLIIDLGNGNSLVAGGSQNLNGVIGLTPAQLVTALNANNLSLNNLNWGVVGGQSDPGNTYIYTTVNTGIAGGIGNAVSDNDTIGFSIVSGNRVVNNPGAGAGTSVKEAWLGGTGSVSSDYANPTAQTASTFASPVQFMSENFYKNVNGTVVLEGQFTLGSDGSFAFTSAVPEPATYGVVAGLGLLILSIRRQFLRKES